MSSTVILVISAVGFFVLFGLAWKILESLFKGALLALIAVSIFYYLVPVAEDRAEIIDGAKNAVKKTAKKAKELAPKAKEAAQDLIDQAQQGGQEDNGQDAVLNSVE